MNKEDRRDWFKTNLHIQKGDVITSRKGILTRGFDGQYFVVKKVRIEGAGLLVCEGEKEPIDVVIVDEKRKERIK